MNFLKNDYTVEKRIKKREVFMHTSEWQNNIIRKKSNIFLI